MPVGSVDLESHQVEMQEGGADSVDFRKYRRAR
jgi:hypothetical protein